MSPAFQQTLPQLDLYRAALLGEGAPPVLPLVPVPPEGLIGILPPPPPERSGWPWTIQSPPIPRDEGERLPLISIVIPSFQQAEFLEETIRSVLLQNHPRLELILMDGGSTDGSTRVIERYRPWLSFARVGPDRGQAHAINLGFSLSAREGLRGWLNSDDLYLPGALRRVAQEHHRTRAEFIYGDQLVLAHETGRIQIEAMPPARDRYLKFPALVASHASFWTAARHVPLWEEQHCAIDYELWIRLLPGARKAYLPHPLGLVRHHAGAKTFSPAMRAKWTADAERNQLAHPQLYRRRPWLDLEFRLLKGFLRRWRAARLQREFAATLDACGWSSRA